MSNKKSSPSVQVRISPIRSDRKTAVGRTGPARATKPEPRAAGWPFTNARSPHDDVLASESPR